MLFRRSQVVVAAALVASLMASEVQAGFPWPWSKSEADKPSFLSRLTPSFLRKSESSLPDTDVRAQNRDDWYAQRAADPPGSRQRYIHGKLWPPVPRPTGKAQLLSHRFHTSHYWPYPYACYDRAIVKKLSELQTHNGWVKQTTLYDYHFDSDKQELNRAGRERLRWILINAPRKHRNVFVQAAYSEAESIRRMRSVRSESIDIVGRDSVPSIMARNTQPLGRPAAELKVIRQAELDSQLPPRISSPLGQSAEPGG